jgi:hypothetical protein
MQIKQLISKDVKKNIKRFIDNSLEKYDNIYYYNKYHSFYKGQLDITRQIKAKVSLATAWLGKIVSKVDLTKASIGYSDCYIHNTEAQEELKTVRRSERNSIK